MCLCCCLAATSESEAQQPGFLGGAGAGGHSSVDAASELELLPSAEESVNAASLLASLPSPSPAALLPIPLPSSGLSRSKYQAPNTCPVRARAPVASSCTALRPLLQCCVPRPVPRARDEASERERACVGVRFEQRAGSGAEWLVRGSGLVLAFRSRVAVRREQSRAGERTGA
nr:unnamed protein product [Digitaria exilis]